MYVSSEDTRPNLGCHSPAVVTNQYFVAPKALAVDLVCVITVSYRYLAVFVHTTPEASSRQIGPISAALCCLQVDSLVKYPSLGGFRWDSIRLT